MGDIEESSTEYIVGVPLVVMLPMELELLSVNQSAPSGPSVISRGPLLGGRGYSAKPSPPPTVAIVPIWFAHSSVNHSAPSGPGAIPDGQLEEVKVGYSVIAPEVVMTPMLLAPSSANHRLPSGPAVIAIGALFVGRLLLYSVIVPEVVIVPICGPQTPGQPVAMEGTLETFGAINKIGGDGGASSVNQSAPSGPAVMLPGAPVVRPYSVIVPEVVIRPILCAAVSVNQRAPSDPAVMPDGLAPGVSSEVSVIVPLVVMRPILFPLCSVNHKAPSGPGMMPKGRLLGVWIVYGGLKLGACADIAMLAINSNRARRKLSVGTG